jgi:phosphatidate phosphatase APP1
VDRDAWEFQIHGWVFETERRGMTLAVFRKALGIDKDELTPGEKTTFAERARSFLADNERGKRVLIRLCGKEYTLGPTRPDGHLSVQLKVATQAIENSLPSEGDKTRIMFRTVADDSNGRVFSGEVHVLEPTGISVISDIDDTIKVSHVTDRKALLRNTFLKPFQPVEGMAEVYRT